MKTNPNDYLNKQHDIKHNIPHVTLMVADGYKQKHVGNIMAESKNIVFKPLKENMKMEIGEVKINST